MYKAAVIGGYDSIYGYASAGMTIMPVSTAEECERTFRRLNGSQYGVVFVTEDYAPVVAPLIENPLPAVMYIPSQQGGGGYAARELHTMVEKAAGADLLN